MTVGSEEVHLGNIVIGIALQLNGDAAAHPGCQRLTSMSCQLDVNGVCWQALLPKPLDHLVTQGCASCPVGVDHRHLQVDGLGVLGLGVIREGGGALGDQLDI